MHGRLGMDIYYIIKTHRTEIMADLSTILGKEIDVFRLDLNESREGFCWRGRGRSFHVDGPKTEKVSSASRPRPAL